MPLLTYLCDELSLMNVEIRAADLDDLSVLASHNNCSTETHTTSLDFDQDVVWSKLWKRDGDNAIFLWLRVPVLQGQSRAQATLNSFLPHRNFC